MAAAAFIYCGFGRFRSVGRWSIFIFPLRLMAFSYVRFSPVVTTTNTKLLLLSSIIGAED